MCGIVGYIGSKTDIKNALETLKKLEYRGYDSAGVAFVKRGKIQCFKRVGQINNLIETIGKKSAKICICHTRWATHGKATEENAHPIMSYNNNFSVVHNGIIENYKYLKAKIGAEKFSTSTDTEVICNLLEYLKGDTISRVIECESLLEGSYASLIIDKCNKYIYAIKNKSPMYIACGKKGTTIASDISCLNAEYFYNLPDHTVAKINKKEITFYSNGNIIDLPLCKNIHNFESNDLGQYNTYMQKEIAETNKTISNIVELYSSSNNYINENIFKGIKNVILTGCGTAYHACCLGANWIQKNLKIPASAYIASELRYSEPILDDSSLMVLVSQSGETADTLAAGELAKDKGCRIITITNVGYSTLANLADVCLPLCAGAEIAVASTKAYTAMLAVLYLLSHATSGFIKSLQNLKEICQKFNSDNISKDIVKKVINSKRVFFIGRLDDGVTASEGALKLKEIAYIDACGYFAGELKHGTIALIENDVVVIAIITNPNLKQKTLNAVEEVVSRGAEVIIITNDKSITGYTTIFIDTAIDEELNSLLSVYPLQKLACEVSLSLGFNPDKPRNLAKSVTVE